MKSITQTIQNDNQTSFTVNQAFVGLGLSKTDESTLRYFDFFSKQFDIPAAYFLHVLPAFNLLNAMFEKDTQALIGDYSLNEDMLKRIEAEVKKNFPSREEMYVEYEVKEGKPLALMLEKAKEIDVDLLVIGQEKDKTEHRIQAKRIAQKADRNVLVVPEGAATKLSTILVPVDFSENSARALQTAIDIQKKLKVPARIICLNVFTIPSITHFRIDRPWIQFKHIVEENIRDAFEEFLQKHIPNDRDRVDVELVERETPGTARAIMNYANESGIDFMVIGAKGRSKLHLLLMGSVTETVLNFNENFPTLVIK